MKNQLPDIARTAGNIRLRVLEHIIKNGGGYMSQACSSAEMLAALYLRIMNLPVLAKPLSPLPFPGVPSLSNYEYFTGAVFNGGHIPEFDRFYLSPAHYALPLYAALIEVRRMSEDGLDHFNRDGSSVEMIGAEHSPGMEVTSGSLGQGLAQAAGAAHARRLKGETGRNFVFMSDGEFEIGMTWETVQAISFYRLDNLTVFIDVNGQQCDGPVESVMEIRDISRKLESFGAVTKVVDGHNIALLEAASQTDHHGKPLFILAKTDPCRGLDILRRNEPKLHYLRFKNQEEILLYTEALKQMKEEKL